MRFSTETESRSSSRPILCSALSGTLTIGNPACSSTTNPALSSSADTALVHSWEHGLLGHGRRRLGPLLHRRRLAGLHQPLLDSARLEDREQLPEAPHW